MTESQMNAKQIAAVAMTVEAIQETIQDEGSFKRIVRSEEFIKAVTGRFTLGRVANLHQVVMPDGSVIRLKFFNTVKKLFNSKNVELVGKESFLSYLEVTVLPKASKGYCFSQDADQIVWGTSKTKAQAKHDQSIADLVSRANAFGINLEAPGAWSTVYSENY